MAVALPREAQAQALGPRSYLVIHLNRHPRPSFAFNVEDRLVLQNVLRDRFDFRGAHAESLAVQLGDLLHSWTVDSE